MKVIRFRRVGKMNWEIAFNETNLREKLDGDMAEIIMPAKPLLVQLWRRLSMPLQWWVGHEMRDPICHWYKTTWTNVLLGRHRGQKIRLGWP